MTNPFARFVHTSPLASLPHDPSITLASNCVRDYFGPSVQIVSDCLQIRGNESTLGQIISTITVKSRPKCRNEERKQILQSSKLQPAFQRELSTPAIRASLLTLIQHSIVIVHKNSAAGTKGKRQIYTYKFNPDRARLVTRYPRFIEYARRALDDTAAALVEELLIRGRMTTVQCVLSTVEQIQQRQEQEEASAPRSDRYTCRQAVLESLRRLVGGGFIQEVKAIVDDAAEEEAEFQLKPPSPKKARTEDDNIFDEDPTVVSLLQGGQYKVLKRETVWRVNVRMFHDSLRAVSLGWLVSQRFGHKVQSSGSIVTAALKLAAHKLHADHETDFEARSSFVVGDIMKYLPKSVLQIFEKKPGGAIPNIHKAIIQLSKLTTPAIVEEFEVADGRLEEAKFQIAIQKLVQYLQDRIIYQLVHDSYGEVAARICIILLQNGHLESDAIAEAAMVPAKDTRELLHRLYRANYISLFNVNQAKQHNPANMFYLWTVARHRTLKTATDTVATCLVNMRLRRQHEVEIGKEWIDRAKEAGETDENENETDKVNYQKFCQGLERLDNAALQLDETLMVLRDY